MVEKDSIRVVPTIMTNSNCNFGSLIFINICLESLPIRGRCAVRIFRTERILNEPSSLLASGVRKIFIKLKFVRAVTARTFVLMGNKSPFE